MDEIRILNRIAGRPLDAYGTRRTLAELAERFAYAFRPWQPPGFYRPVMVPHPVAEDAELHTLGMTLRLFEQDHGMVKTLGLRIGPFAYSTDVFDLDDRAFAVLDGIETWVVGCFQRGPHRTHAPLPKVLQWVERLRPRRTILTHLGTDMDWAWMHANLPQGVEPGYDGQILDIKP